MGPRTRKQQLIAVVCHTLLVLCVAATVAGSANIGEVGGLWLLFMWVDFPVSLIALLLVWLEASMGLDRLYPSDLAFHQALNIFFGAFFGVVGGLQYYFVGWPGAAVARAAKWVYRTIRPRDGTRN